jgi:aldehyde:ferredoxin oxidoreductase
MEERYGYTGRILWIDLNERSFQFEERDDSFWRIFIGGGLLGTRLLIEKTPQGIDPLGSENPLIFASSVIGGHPGVGLTKFVAVAKSPLTGGIGETRAVGPFSIAMKGIGADVIVVLGQSQDPVILLINNNHVDFLNAGEIWGKTVGETTDCLENLHGKQLHTAVIGPAGENMVRFASIVTDRSFQVPRMGMGAVMGSKKLKAIALNGDKRPKLFDKRTVGTLSKYYKSHINDNDLVKWQYEKPGFSCWIYLHGLDAALCTNNYSKSIFEAVDGYKEGVFMENYIDELPCPGCPNNCIKSIHPKSAEDYDRRASGIHQEIVGTMGPNIGNAKLQTMLIANNLCNQYGLDPTSLGFTISFAMELFEKEILKKEDYDGRELHFGDSDEALRMIEQITRRQGLGDILAEGTKRAAKTIGGGAEQFAMHVKGQEMVPIEPRSQTNLALGYSVAPIGPRHDICEHDWDFDTRVGWTHTLDLSRTIGILNRIPMEYIGTDKVRNFKALYTLWSAADAYLFCIFATAPTRLLSLQKMTEMLHAVTGWETSSYEIMRAGERRDNIMRWYNLREGMTRDDDTLPDRFFTENIKDGPKKGDVLDREKFNSAIQDFYLMMGWDEDGVPRKQTLYDSNLEFLLS